MNSSKFRERHEERERIEGDREDGGGKRMECLVKTVKNRIETKTSIF